VADLLAKMHDERSFMSLLSTSAGSTVPLGRQRRLPNGVAFYLQASIASFFLAASSAPTPLYAVYQAEWGFSPITTTVVFGVYALAVLAALLTVGSLSDHVGRRPVLIGAIALQAAAMLIFTTAGGVPALLLARVVQGLATGAAAGAVGAGLLDVNRSRGTITNAVAPIIGTASGGIGAGLLVQYLPAPAHLVYLVLLGVFILQGIGVALMPETSTPAPGALASLRPRFGVPPAARRPLLVATPVLVAVWALAGFYGSIGPTVVRQVVGSNSLLLGGLALFVLAASGGVTVLLMRDLRPRTVMVFGIVALLAGVAITLLAIASSSATPFFIGTAVAGAGFGAGFQGAVRTLLPLAAPHERAGLLSTVYVVCYLAMGAPAVIAGLLVVYAGGVLTTAREYGLALMALAAATLVGVAWPRRQEAPAPGNPSVEPSPELAETR
jgi:predicted MFS family arabinose efflux permease